MANTATLRYKPASKRRNAAAMNEVKKLNLDNFDYLSPIDTRYYGADTDVFSKLHPYLSEAGTISYQIKVEQAIVATLEEAGVAPSGTSAAVALNAAKITPEQVYAEEHKTHHNIRALVNCLRADLPDEMRGYVHLFATSADIQDTARSVAFRDLTRDVLLPEMRSLIEELIALAERHATTVQIGRTHGRYAEPITVGYWLANFVSRLTQRAEKLSETAAELRGMFSGAVGAHSALALRWPDDPAAVELDVLSRLGLKPADGSISTQVIQPEYLADFGHALVSAFGVMANIADDFRNLMRNEIEEVGERLAEYQVGSSTMPHKINPKNFENVKSMWKAFVPRMTTVYMDQISEHQRDLTNSASTRFFNELVAATYYATYRLKHAIRKTEINKLAIDKNLRDSFQWITAEPLYIAFALARFPDPYDKLRSFVLEARAQGRDLLSFLETDPDARATWEKVSDEIKDIIRNPSRYIGDAISRTRLVCDDARMRLQGRLFARLDRPDEQKALMLT